MICKDYWNRYKQGFLDITEARSFKVCVMTCVTAFHEPCLLILVPMTITNFQNFQHLKESVLLSILGEFFCPFILSKTAIKQKQTKNKYKKKKKGWWSESCVKLWVTTTQNKKAKLQHNRRKLRPIYRQILLTRILPASETNFWKTIKKQWANTNTNDLWIITDRLNSIPVPKTTNLQKPFSQKQYKHCAAVKCPETC